MGKTNQGTNAIAIGQYAGRTNQCSQSICINASSSDLTGINSGFYVSPVRSFTETQYMLGYNSSNEIIQNPDIGSYVIAGCPFSVSADNAEQFRLTGKSNKNKQLLISYNTATDNGRIDAIEQGVSYKNLILDSSSTANVGIGKSPVYQLELSLNSAGKPTSNTWTISSDVRLKEDIVDADLDICYNVVKILPLRRYKWKEEYYPNGIQKDRHSVGFIANEVQSVYPKAITIIEKQDFLVKKPETTEDKAEYVSLDNVLNIDVDQIYKTMYGSIKKLIEKVETLEQKVETLENTIISDVNIVS